MTDRELLEDAANAAGITGEWSTTMGGWDCLIEPNGHAWQPIYDDGDALRLAVKRRFHVCIFSATDGDIKVPGFVEVWQEMDTDPLHVEYFEGADYEAATRRAIVRAAAAIGAAK